MPDLLSIHTSDDLDALVERLAERLAAAPLPPADPPEDRSELLEALGQMDPDDLSPKQAHDLLYRLKQLAKQ